MPETDIEGATILAERVRKTIENLETKGTNVTIKATISLGVTGFKEGMPKTEKGSVIALADKALYISKQSGGNRVTAVKMAGG